MMPSQSVKSEQRVAGAGDCRRQVAVAEGEDDARCDAGFEWCHLFGEPAEDVAAEDGFFEQIAEDREGQDCREMREWNGAAACVERNEAVQECQRRDDDDCADEA